MTGKFLIGSQRPEDIKYSNVAVNKVYCDGILVWQRAATFEKNHGNNYLQASRTITWTANDASAETPRYTPNTPAATTSTFSLDLTSIPRGAIITSATITWDYAFSTNSSTPSSWLGTTTTAVYIQDSNTAKVSDKILNCTNDIVPGAINTLTLYYQQKGASFNEANNGATIKRTRYCTLSNITITVQYKI